jgi:hypothetical protein
MSQPSFGEQSVNIGQRQAGRVRVLGVNANGTIVPRLLLRIGMTLEQRPPDFVGAQPVDQYSLRGLTGQLRLTEHADAIASLQWIDPQNAPRSAAPSYECNATVSIDVDCRRIETIERWRDGKPPRFWLQLWPSFLSNTQGWYDAEVRAFPFEVPRDTWIAALTGLGLGRFLVLEVPLTTVNADVFTQTSAHLGHALNHLDRGYYSDAVSACRLAIDAMFTVLTGKVQFADYLAAHTDQSRAKKYSQLLTGLKELTHLPHHPSAGTWTYVRAEAVFVVQTTQHLVALVGDLVRPE